MPRRKETFTSGCYYHIFNRVVEGEILFVDPPSYLLFLDLVKKNASKCEVIVLCYCLMPNHYHFLLRQDAVTPISKFISLLLNSYVQKVNQMRRRKGPLFTGRFKSVLIDREEYLIHLCRYIHLNPVKSGLVCNPEDWHFSNYLDWIGKRGGELIDPEFISTHFRSSLEYRDFVVNYVDDGLVSDGIREYLLD